MLLPEQVQREILSFVEFVEQRDSADDTGWSALSLDSAMHGLENDTWPDYSDADLKHNWK